MAEAQVLVEPSLDDPEQGAVAPRILEEPGLLAPPRPPRRPGQRLLVVRARALRRRALVEGHEDVAAELQLDARRALRSQLLPAAVEVTAEDGALFGDPALFGKRVDLEAARIGEDVAVPGHEPVQSTHLRHQRGARTKQQVVRVRQDDLRADALQIVGRNRLHGGGGAHRHELRRVDLSVRKQELAPARGAVGMGDGELHAISIASP